LPQLELHNPTTLASCLCLRSIGKVRKLFLHYSFEHRLGVKMEANLNGRQRLLNLWKSQNGLCPICGQKITEITGWHSHHIIWRSKGGTDAAENQVLLHPNCHSKVHCQNLPVVKPRPAGGAIKA